MPESIGNRILAAVGRGKYQPLKPKALARKIGVVPSDYANFRKVLGELVDQGRVEISKSHAVRAVQDRKSTRLNSSHSQISYAVFCLKKKNTHFWTC